jgi:uncharacterized phage-associated protein/DNA-binding transcriptional regulator YiaG
MKSPITGKAMKLCREKRTFTFRKETFDIMYHYYLCESSNETFESESLIQLNLTQVHNQYRAKYGLPFPDEIKALRQQYDFSASMMSEILGFGANVYRQYEADEVPSVSNGRLIQLIKNKEEFRKLIDLNHQLNEKEKQRALKKLESAAVRNIDPDVPSLSATIKKNTPSIFTGYRMFSLDKTAHMILFFTSHLAPFKTKLNKLLYYADFLHFKKNCFSISGTIYKAIQLGPVPQHYGSLFDYVADAGLVVTDGVSISNDNIGERFIPTPDGTFNPALFSPAEIETLEQVVALFGKDSVSTIVKKSHDEKGWINNADKKGFISYNDSFDLIHA